MKHHCSTIARQIVIAATLGLAAIASWAMTDFRAPAIEASITQVSPG
ncbi:hypothetical protein [Caenimonas aquaedulcis]|uniref:Uncharacterized protein n=1 Tax=Caenimonas aquaedulcis TaxID=2793270 RepID=A0A931H7Z3_9BURK|nr:hypothetical protein [Caenimonas aquaedulcis]MBG9390374.1 hypothetical protein [Caenimonas aquaedulcis]